MTILTLDRKEFERKVGKIDAKTEKLITDMGTPIEYINDNEVAVEVFPNRPDLLSLQNFAVAVNQFKGKKKISKFKINSPEKDYEVIIDKSVKQVRPFTVCCIVKGLKFNDEKIKEIIDLQEKLHNSIGRKRKKLAIGIYPLEKISLPITYRAKDPTEIKFRPLEFPREITGKQILSQHPTGREYGDLLKDAEVFPIFEDSNKNILSMPPIINSHETGRITEKTKEIFIECSGANLHYLKKALAIIVATLSEMGGKIYAMNIKDKKDGDLKSPSMEPEKMPFRIENINKTLGIDFTEKQIKTNLAKMGIDLSHEKNQLVAEVPSYRTDIIHWIDLTEEVAIAHGYDNFEPIIPKISTIAEEDQDSKNKKLINNILSGLGLLEVSSFHLTTKKNIKKTHFEFNEFIELEDSKTQRDVLRYDLFTNLMQIFSENSDSAYPQKIYELGRTFKEDKEGKTQTGVEEVEKLAIALVDESITFTEIKQILDYLFKMLKVNYSLKEEEDHPAYITGRCGKIIVNNKEIGHIGEIAPRVLKNWKIKVPGVALEINTQFLLE
jgi:phenylalanyl-tRNA synthetase beta chain